MSQIIRHAAAGTLESSDVYVEIEPSDAGLSLELESVVVEQFGDAIEAVVREVLEDCGISSALVRVSDRGALECVLRARVETAVRRGEGEV